jgi:hypothetical protein
MKSHNFAVKYSRMKRTYLLVGALTLVSVFLFAFVLNRTPAKGEFLEKHAELVIRKVGHQLLLHAGDSSSRILPVKQISDGTFQMEFQSEFSFKPDTLIKIVRQNLSANDLPLNYLVSVLDCTTKEVVYGFEINPSKNNVISCQGRTQPKGCYSIQIAFVDFMPDNTPNPILYPYGSGLVFISLIAFIGYGFLKKEKRKTPPVDMKNSIKLGSFLLFTDQRLLTNNTERIELSDKEARLLEIFASQPNQLIERDRLLKEVWEDDGIFTARSLDMFVSKLRKKLKNDPSIQITNVYGKGYKLEIVE